MKAIKIDLPQDLQFIDVCIFSDWHIGDRNIKWDEIRAEIEAVKSNPQTYVICNGDLLNNATKSSVSDCYAEELSPMSQLDKLVELLTPVKDRILCMTMGNHEARTYRNDGIDLIAMAAHRLGIFDRYAREAGLIFLRLGKQTMHRHSRRVLYSIYCTHGSGGGRKEGGKVNRLAELAGIIDADIYVSGHTHLPFAMKESYYRIDLHNSAICPVDKLFVNSSAKLGYGGYGEAASFKPASTANPKIRLDGVKKEFTVYF